MLKKHINIKGLRKKIRKIDYENFLFFTEKLKELDLLDGNSATSTKGQVLKTSLASVGSFSESDQYPLVEGTSVSLIDKKLNLSMSKGRVSEGTRQAFGDTVLKTDASATSKQTNKLFPSYKILILRSEPIRDTVKVSLNNLLYLKKIGQSLSPYNKGAVSVGGLKLCSKCVTKSIFKKVTGSSVNKSIKSEGLTGSKYVYWIDMPFGPVVEGNSTSSLKATRLKEQLIQINFLKSIIKAEPRESFLGCLIASSVVPADLSTCQKGLITLSGALDSSLSSNLVHTEPTIDSFYYKYYYPTQILSICDSFADPVDIATSVSNNSSIADEYPAMQIFSSLLQTIESPILSISNILAGVSLAKKASLSTQPRS